MSAAEHADPGPDQPGPATVLSFPTAIRPSRRTARRERTAVPPQPNPNLSPHEKLAGSVERLFADHGRTLTDETTAKDFLITLTYVRKMLEGARHQDLINEEQQQDLDAMVQGMMAAPGLLAPE